MLAACWGGCIMYIVLFSGMKKISKPHLSYLLISSTAIDHISVVICENLTVR